MKIPINIGGSGIGSDDCTATLAQVLSPYTAVTSDSDDEASTGTMTDNGAVSQTLSAGGSYTIPQGYHNGSGKVTATALSSQTSATASAADILSGKTAWVDGSKLTGTMTNNGAVSKTLSAGGSYTIAKGYHNGSGKVTVTSYSVPSLQDSKTNTETRNTSVSSSSSGYYTLFTVPSNAKNIKCGGATLSGSGVSNSFYNGQGSAYKLGDGGELSLSAGDTLYVHWSVGDYGYAAYVAYLFYET